MVKIPGLDDLKKMGSDLVTQAKSVNLGGMVDKVKSGITGKKASEIVTGNEDLKSIFQGIENTLSQLSSNQTTQSNAIKEMEQQLKQLANAIEKIQGDKK